MKFLGILCRECQVLLNSVILEREYIVIGLESFGARVGTRDGRGRLGGTSEEADIGERSLRLR